MTKIQQIVNREEGMAVVVIDKHKTVGIITKMTCKKIPIYNIQIKHA